MTFCYELQVLEKKTLLESEHFVILLVYTQSHSTFLQSSVLMSSEWIETLCLVTSIVLDVIECYV